MSERGASFQEIAQAALAVAPTLLGRWLPDGKRRGKEWVAKNPTRSDRRAGSFSVCTRTGRWHDFATGDRGGDLVALYAWLHGLRQGEAARELAGELGLGELGLGGLQRPARAIRAAVEPREADRVEEQEKTRKRGRAQAIWQHARPAAGSEVEAYLRGRGITMAVPATIRVARLRHPSTGTTEHPAMVAAMQVGREITGVHRTFLAPGGAGKAAVDPAKMMLGIAEGAVVRLGPTGPLLALAEGIETALSVAQLAPAWTVWAALSAGNLSRVAIPDGVRRLVVVADGDAKYEPRLRSIRRVGLSEARRAVDQLGRMGLRAAIVVPDDGLDANDVLQRDPEAARRLARFLGGFAADVAERAA